MNVDAWLSGEEGTLVQTAIAEALSEHSTPWVAGLDGWRCSCGHKFATQIAALLHQADHALRAALSLTTTCACEECGGTGEVERTGIEGGAKFCRICNRTLTFNFMDRPAERHTHPCPDCKGGTIPGEPALLRALVEPVGRAVDATASGTVTIGDVQHYPAPGEMTYRLVERAVLAPPQGAAWST